MPPTEKAKTEATPADPTIAALDAIAAKLDELPDRIADAIEAAREKSFNKFIDEMPEILPEIISGAVAAFETVERARAEEQAEDNRQAAEDIARRREEEESQEIADGLTLTPDADPPKPHVSDTPELTVTPDES